jgi:hypothetical protein
MGTWGTGLTDNDHALDDAWDLLSRAGLELPDGGPEDAAVEALAGAYLRGLGALLRRRPSPSLTAACERRLDELPRAPDLYRAADLLGAPLAILLFAGARPAKERLAGWRSAFDDADGATLDEREFWDEYAGRVRAALAVLAG